MVFCALGYLHPAETSRQLLRYYRTYLAPYMTDAVISDV